MASAPLRHSPAPYYSLDEYFALELASGQRHEYWRGEIVCMSGGSDAHGQITINMLESLVLQLRGGPCRPRTEGTAVRNPLAGQSGQPPYVYPDVSVVCGERRIENVRGVDTLVNPSLVVEALSSSTAGRDLNEKLVIYQAIPTLQDYLVVASETIAATHWRRNADGDWRRADYADQLDEIELGTGPARLALRDIYAGLPDWPPGSGWNP